MPVADLARQNGLSLASLAQRRRQPRHDPRKLTKEQAARAFFWRFGMRQYPPIQRHLQGKIMRVFIGLAFAMLLSACATSYGKSNIFGGYWDKPGPGELIEVGFDGNGYISGDRVETYLMYRSAEVAQSRGKRHFSIYHTLHDAILDKPLADIDSTAIGGKPYGKVFMLLHDVPVAGSLETEAILAKYRDRIPGAKRAAEAASRQEAK